ncbi:MAG: hypothetical protein IT475_10190 [Aquimonas sp.]|nr:hypothetical protein [Aquimonas sp.]
MKNGSRSVRRVIFLGSFLSVILILLAAWVWRGNIAVFGFLHLDRSNAVMHPTVDVGDMEMDHDVRPAGLFESSGVVNAGPNLAELLPPVDVPLSMQLNSLVAEAEKGNSVASCRLILAVGKCKEASRHAAFSKKVQELLATRRVTAEEAAIEFVAMSEEQLETSSGFCAGLGGRDMPDTTYYFKRTFLNFTPRQLTLLAMSTSGGDIRRLIRPRSYSESGTYLIPQFIAENIEEFLMSGYRAKDPLALEGMILLHAPSNSLKPIGVTVWLPNPEKYFYYASLYGEIFGYEALGEAARTTLVFVRASLSEEYITRVLERVQADAIEWRHAAKGLPDRSGVTTSYCDG